MMDVNKINRNRLLWASFFTIVTGGVGFAVRGAILVDWGNQFGFTMTELGSITGCLLVPILGHVPFCCREWYM